MLLFLNTHTGTCTPIVNRTYMGVEPESRYKNTDPVTSVHTSEGESHESPLSPSLGLSSSHIYESTEALYEETDIGCSGEFSFEVC